MKKNIPVTLLLLCFTAVSTFAMSVNAYTLYSDMCGTSSGAAYVDVSGGAPPYTYLWSNGATTDTIYNLISGSYDVTVTDAGGATMTSTTFIQNYTIPDLNVIALGMPSPGMNNGYVEFIFYSFGGIVPGTYTFNLVDSLGNNYFNGVETCPCMSYVLDYRVRNLPPGSYHLTVATSIGCTAYADFVLRELPAITPTFVTSPSCNGSPTGIISVNMHPQPTLDTSALAVYLYLEAHPFAGNYVSEANYKMYIKNSLGQYTGGTIIFDSVQVGTQLAPDNYTLEIRQGEFNDPYETLIYSAPFTIANDTSCSLISGKLFADYDGDCTYNNIDLSLNAATIQLNPGPYYGVTNASGEFYIPVAPGSYTIQQFSSFPHVQKCPVSSYQVNITQGQIVNVTIADSITGKPDVQVGLSSYTQPRPGFGQHYRVTYKNISPFYVTPATVTLTYDALVVINNSYPTPATSAAGQLKWNVDSLPPFGETVFDVNGTVSSGTALGTVLNAVASVTSVANEIVLNNNSDSISQTVTGSFDPNLKEVSPVGGGSQGYITNTELLEYTIHFQNTGTDTAFFVTVYDTLPAALDITTLQMMNSSHNYSYELKAGNIVIFHFDNILLVDSNANEEASHGVLKFSIHQKANNAPGTVLNNSAAIVFDFNAPVITNDVVNTIYQCSQLATASVSSQVVCEGDSIMGSSNVLFPVSSAWELDGTGISNDQSVTLINPAGNYALSFVANSAGCSASIPFAIAVNALPAKPVISSGSGTLTSSSATGNQWYYNNTLIPGANQQNCNVNQNGWYVVTVTDGNGCANASDSVYATTVSLNEYFKDNEISIQPNPARDFVTILFNEGNAGNKQLFLKDLAGKIILSLNVTTSQEKIDLHGIAKGVYMIEIISNDKRGYFKLLKE